MQLIPRDIRHAVRSLRRTPAVTAASLLTLGLGMGAATTLYAAVHALLLRPLDFAAPERLVIVSQVWERSPVDGAATLDTLPWWSYPRLEAVRAGTDVFSALVGFAIQPMNLSGGAAPLRGAVEMVDRQYFMLLGRQPRLGRSFSREESVQGGPLAAVISDQLWQRAYGSRTEVLGQAIELDGRSATVIGVMPPGFSGLSAATDVWIPLGAAETMAFTGALTDPGSNWFGVVGRLQPGVTLESARAQLSLVAARVGETLGERMDAVALPLNTVRVDTRVRRAVLILFAATLLVLLIATANIANLQLVRGAARRHELGIRLALGASRRRLLRQMTTEALVLSLLGTVLGLVFSLWATDLITVAGAVLNTKAQHSLASFTTFDTIGVTASTLLFGLVLAASITLLFGLLPALRATNRNPAAMLGTGNARYTDGRRHRVGGTLVGFEVAIALVLLAAAGLTLRSLANLRAIDTGIQAQNTLTFRISTKAPAGDAMDRATFHARLTAELESLPGVRAAGLSRCLPLSGECDVTMLTRLDDQHFAAPTAPRVTTHSADAGYFDALGIRVVTGRAFRSSDTRGAPKVVIVNRAFVRQILGAAPPVGRRLTISTGFLEWRAGKETAEIVGVVDDVRYSNPEDYMADSAIRPAVYVPVSQYPLDSYYVAVAGTQGTPALSQVSTVVARVAPHLPLYDVRGLEARLDDVTARARLLSVFLSVFAALAALLASLGVYGVLAHVVGGRTREIGVRKALGASPASLVRSMVADGLRPVALGLFAGLLVFLAIGRVLGTLLAGVSSHDPLTLIVASTLLAATGLVASLVPAVRAAGTEPSVALRAE